MGDAAASIVEYFRAKKGIAFINVVANISKECDCAGGYAPVPKINDIGILASTDPVALDRACVDLVKNTREDGTEEWVNQLNNLMGENTIAVAESHGIGTQKYKLILVEDNNNNEDKKDKTILIIIVISTIVGVAILVTTFVCCIMKKNNQRAQEDFHLTQKMNE